MDVDSTWRSSPAQWLHEPQPVPIDQIYHAVRFEREESVIDFALGKARLERNGRGELKKGPMRSGSEFSCVLVVAATLATDPRRFLDAQIRANDQVLRIDWI